VRIVITGAGGMLGRDVAEAAGAAGHAAVLLARADLDVADAEAAAGRIAAAAPDAIVNCAAWTDVDGAEAHEAEALAVNGQGAGNVARAAAAAGAFLVHVSTDYVFDGAADRPYVESDPVAPLGAYGRTKLAGEQAVAGSGADAAIVRTAWLFGVHGRNFVDTMLRLGAERDEVSVVTDQVGCPTWTGHLASALVTVAGRKAGGLHHIAGAGRCSWHGFTQEIFRQAGLACAVRETTAASFPRPAPRPAWSVLGSERPDAVVLPPWEQGLAGYLAARSAMVGT
jgi:dTDP-4-dehydrorhamnose reductase